MNALAFVYNPCAVVLLSPKRWPKLAAPIYGDDNRNKAMAVSVLRGIETLDREPVHACDITAEQARDIGAWLTLSPPQLVRCQYPSLPGGGRAGT
jgi:hypothetical protein